jgi:hypothetical protein
VDPEVTVTSRLHPEYDPSGIRVGAITLLPTLDESFGYDDNVTGTPSPHGSPLIETDGRVESKDEMSDGSIGASASVDDYEYPSLQNQSYTNWSVAGGASHDFGSDTLSLAATHLNLNQTPRDLDVPNLNSSIAYQIDDVRAAYKIDLDPLGIEPSFDTTWYRFQNGTVNGLPYLQSYRDRIAYTPGLTAGYEFATRRRVVLVIKDTNAQFDHAPPTTPRLNYNDLSVLAGLSYDIDGVTGFRLLGGYEQRTFASHAYKMIQAPILEGALTWTPTGLTTVTFTAARYIQDAAAEATTGYTETALRGTVDHELYRNIVLSANGSLYQDDYSQGGSQRFYTVGGGVTWRINRNFRLIGTYTYSSRNSSTPAAFESQLPTGGVFGGDYAENTFLLTLHAAL